MTSLASCTNITTLQEDAETLPWARAHVLVCCQHQAMVASVNLMQVPLIGRVQSRTLLAGMGENSIPSLRTLKYEGVGWVHKRVK